MPNYEVQIHDETGRLDKVVSDQIVDLSRSQVKTAIDENRLLVNGHGEKAKYQVQPGDQITIEIPEPTSLSLEPQDIPLDIIFEDDDVLVVNKPQGMVVHPAPGHPDQTLVNALLFHSPLSTINGEFRPGIVHRIDKDTSGLLMVAKNDRAHRSLSAQLKDKTSLREYVALVHGNIKEETGTIDAPLGRSPKDRKKQAIVADGRRAVTHFQVLERYGEYTLISCRLETGRTHQIRVHFAYIGHPLAGDPLYGPKQTLPGHGQFLHAEELGFYHPVTKEQLVFRVNAPELFQKTVAKLRQRAGLVVDKLV
ncbi:RluA family pseudouridine synthase [Levilactobacillus bambusae]|uniref:Pseudouridine synthase n=1 Tax=Levilactobacillus bambusae TaxID=2024736 RepID=A0A2V1N1B2_9LACO|nr:RluA family pseudouridine synthase [Levilactobacillus bambusae]PWG00862.1 RluA family pseudouridine synthase [Levilactobacillus bambusae]